MSSPARAARVLLEGLGIGECPRWHDDRLWSCNWGTNQIVAVDIDGNSEVVMDDATVSPHPIDWLPDGRLATSTSTAPTSTSCPSSTGR